MNNEPKLFAKMTLRKTFSICYSKSDTLVNSSVHEEVERENWDYDEVALQLREIFHYRMPETFFKLEPSILRSNILEELRDIYSQKETKFSPLFMRHVEKAILLQTVDATWKEHLTIMDHLKEGIGLRGYGQRDPLVEYKLEATDLFNDTKNTRNHFIDVQTRV